MKFMIAAFVFASSLMAQAAETTIECYDRNRDASPYLKFSFTFSGKELPLANPESVSISVTANANFGSKEFVMPEELSGCQNLPLLQDLWDIHFACDADGDNGFGSMSLYLSGLVVPGSITFPEGKRIGKYTIPEDTEIEFECDLRG